MKKNKKFLIILYILIFIISSVAFSSCAFNFSQLNGGQTSQETPGKLKDIVIFNAKDNDTPLTGRNCVLDGTDENGKTKFKYTPTASVKVEESEKPEALKDYDLVKIEKTQTIYLNMKYSAKQIEGFKAQGYTYLSFKFMFLDAYMTEHKIANIGANFGLFARHSNFKGTQWRVDRPIVYKVNIPIDQLIAEMTDTTDDMKEYATLNEREVLLTKRFWDTALNFQIAYFTDMVLIADDSRLYTTPNFDATNPKPIG